MKILIVTEKCSPLEASRDGGARLVETLKQAFGNNLSIMQFGINTDNSANWCFNYPSNLPNRFEKRLANADFIAKQIKKVEQNFTHIIFIHISMQFGLVKLPLRNDIQVWTFPMFLTPSYIASGEIIPAPYFEIEHSTLIQSKNIITPSYLEKRQLIELYKIPEEYIHVIPRGINTKFLKPKIRYLNGPPKFCSIGSIKPQKNILGLVYLFARIQKRLPGSMLKIIGPVQNNKYFNKVQECIYSLGLEKVIELTGHISPEKLSDIIEDVHIHISNSCCETFGRSIFETLACGLPNIARLTGNAAAEFLEELPYIKFTDDNNIMLNLIEEMLLNLSELSSLSIEIGELYDDTILSKLLIAKISKKESIAISDFDGTLFHKYNSEKTYRCIEAFKSFSLKVICSARSLSDLIDQLKIHNLEVDWIIAYSGAVIADGRTTQIISITPLNPMVVNKLESSYPENEKISLENNILQIRLLHKNLPYILGIRTEFYENSAYIMHWKSSKLRAVNWLLKHINWSGQVHSFGDGPYDKELLNYFDGIFITPSPINHRQKMEIESV